MRGIPSVNRRGSKKELQDLVKSGLTVVDIKINPDGSQIFTLELPDILRPKRKEKQKPSSQQFPLFPR